MPGTKKTLKKIWRVVSNKFFFTSVIFFSWMIFFDQNDWFSIREKKKELQVAKDNAHYLEAEIARMQKENIELKTEPAKLEQFARENYRMKRDNEDVYIVDKGSN